MDSGEKLQQVNNKRSKQCCFLPSRHIFILMGFTGCSVLYILKINLSLTIISMVSPGSSTTNLTRKLSECAGNVSEDFHLERSQREFNWDEKTKGIILSSFFWGYICTQIPGGRVAEIYGSKYLLGGSILIPSILTLLSPLAARMSHKTFIACRVMEGFFEGVSYPAMHAMIARWIPRYERGLMSAIVYSGAQIGTVVTMLFSGVIASSPYLGGWPSVFYISGVIGIVWFALWMLLVYESPEEDPRISNSELNYILKGIGDQRVTKRRKIPLAFILKSTPVWALIIANFGQCWGYFTLLLQLPSYFENVLGFSIKQNGALSALPYLLQALGGWLSSYFLDRVIRARLAEINTVRKIANTIGFAGPGLCLLGVVLVKCNKVANVVLFCLAMTLNGFMYSGYHVCHVDMAPDFAGTLMGMTNTFGNFAAILAPYVVGVLTQQDETSLQNWSYVFCISAGIYLATAVIFVCLGSGKLQSWAVAQ